MLPLSHQLAPRSSNSHPRLTSLALALALVLGAGPALGGEGAPQAGTPGRSLTFVDEAAQLGLDAPGFGRGAAWIDLDGDGLLDIVDTSAGGDTRFWRRRADGLYEDAGALWGVPVVVEETWGVLAADFDNDGDPDLAFPTGGFGAIQPNRLLRNDLSTSGVFTDIAAQAGDYAGQAATFGGCVLDYDADGDLDLFFSNARFAAGSATCTLLRNDLELGAGLSFSDVSQEAGITHLGSYQHTTSGDFDNDGWMDIGVGSVTGPNRLYRNDGDGSFSEVAQALGVDSPFNNFGFVLEDFDNDGWLDVYLPKFQLDPMGPSELYRGDGAGGFVNVSAASGLTGQTDMGHNTADVDADGYPDIYVGTGSPSAAVDDILYLVSPSPQGLLATDISLSSGILAQGPTRLHGIVFADEDGDGDLDIFANNGGPSSIAGTIQRNFFWRSAGTGAHWLAVDLAGRVSNPDAIGARVCVLLPDGRRVYRRRSVGHGFANTDPATLHFGLGSESQPVAIEVDWPSGLRQSVPLAGADQRQLVAESGLLLAVPPTPGGSFTVLVVGAPGERVTLWLEGLSSPGGMLPLATALPAGALELGVTGTFALSLPVQPAFAGQTWTFGALFSSGSGAPVSALPLDVSLP